MVFQDIFETHTPKHSRRGMDGVVERLTNSLYLELFAEITIENLLHILDDGVNHNLHFSPVLLGEIPVIRGKRSQDLSSGAAAAAATD